MSDEIKEVLAAGLFSKVEEDSEGYFTWQGCDVGLACDPTLGNQVKDFQGYRSLEEAQSEAKKGDNLYEFAMCHECHYRALYGES